MTHTLPPSIRRVGQLLLAGLILLSSPAQAGDEPAAGSGTLSFRGFGTIGLARSSSDQADFVRDLSQPRGIGVTSKGWSGRIDTVLGLQANWQASQEIELVGQLVSRYRYDASFHPELLWGFVKWNPNETLSLRAGRLGTDFFMLADSRLVGYSYLTVRPPADYFGALPFSYIEGADAVASLPTPAGILRGKLFAGYSREKAPLADRLWDLNGSFMRGGHVDFQTGPWQLRAGLAKLRFEHDLPIDELTAGLNAAGLLFPSAIDAANALSVRGKDSRFASLGAAYDAGPLQLQLMLSKTQQESTLFQNSRAGYLLAGYRLGRFTPFAGYSWVKSTPKALATGLPNVAPFAALNTAVAGVLADSHSSQHTVSLGVRWDLCDNTALKLQFDAVRGTPGSVFPYRRETANWTGRTHVISAVVDFVF